GGGDDARRHQQRLGHGGVAEGVRIGFGAVAEQVDAGRGRERRERLIGSRQLAPRGQEAGLLRPLSGTDDREHGDLQGGGGGGGGGPPARGGGPVGGGGAVGRGRARGGAAQAGSRERRRE